MDETRKLAAFCAGVTFDSLPAEVVEKAKLCVLDFFANVYGSHELDAVARVTGYVRSLGGPETASALGCGFRTGIHNAAFLNGTAAEAIEGQDGLRFGGNHPGTAVIPAALALAERDGRTGKELIAAIVVGYEAAGRIAAAVHPRHTLSGFLPTGTCGAFGAAAAASVLSGYDAETTASALGNAGYLLPLSMAETLMGGYTSKIVQGGQAASAGLTAAGLAGAGVTGAPYVLEGSDLGGGFAKITTGGEPMLDRITAGLAETYSIADIYFKPYTACRHTHGCAEAALALVREKKIDPAEVASIDAFTYGIAVLAVGKPVGEQSTFVSAQFSIPYVVAACILDGEMGPAQMRESRIADPAVLDLAAKVRVQLDAELADRYPEYTASRVEIALKSGERFAAQVDVPKGDPRSPMSAADLTDKLRRFAPKRDAAALGALADAILDLENGTDVRRLTALAG